MLFKAKKENSFWSGLGSMDGTANIYHRLPIQPTISLDPTSDGIG
jgi:hypothetical protein